MSVPRFPPTSLLAAALACAAIGAGPRAASADEKPSGDVVALVGGEVRTVSGAVLPKATVLVGADGRIQAVGPDVAVPAGARRIECGGKIVTPGLIDADCWLGLAAPDVGGGVPGAHTPVLPAYDAWDARLRTARAQGVTALHLAGNRVQPLGGVTAVVPTGPPGAPPIAARGAVALNASAAGAAASGLPAAARIAGLRGTLVDILGREDDLARWRADLATYDEDRVADGPTAEERLLLPPELLERMRTWTPADKASWREAVYKGMGREKAYTKPKKPAAPPKAPGESESSDMLAALLGIEGRKPSAVTFLRAELDVDVGLALGIVRDFGLDAVLVGGQGLADRAKEVSAAQARVVLTQTADTSWSATSPLRRREPGLGAALAAAGLRPAVASGGAGAARHLRLLAAAEVGEGMSRRDALAAVTLWAAEAAGVGAETGSIEPGKRADLVVWDGDPLAAATRAVHVLVGGVAMEVDGGRAR